MRSFYATGFILTLLKQRTAGLKLQPKQ